MSQLGRISGQLLKDNLTRNGHDLTFDNDLLHLDVTGRRIGIKKTNPDHELDVNGTTKTTDLVVTTQSDLADLTVLGDTITSNTGTLNLTNSTSDQVTVTAKLVIDDIDINTNIISTNTSTGPNTNLELRPNGTGSVDIYADTNVYGNIYATGNIRADGNITVGDANTDNITINADVASDIIPDTDITHRLGNNGTGYVEGVEFTLGNVTLTVSGTGTTVVLSIPAAGPTWINTLIAHTVGKSYQIALDGTPGIYSVNTLGAWTGTNPKTVSTTNDGLIDGTYNVSSIRFDQKRWLDLWVKNVYTDAIVSGDITIDGINLNSVQGKIYYVATNGSDTNAGQHQNDPFATVKKALSVATSEDQIYIYPGTYVEEFPLVVPVGVDIRGTGIRSVKITPTTATRYNDAFLINGESTVEDITIADFFSGGNYFTVTAASAGSTTVNVGTAPYAHTYVSGGTINIGGTNRVITNAVYTHTTGVLVLTHTGGTATPSTTVFLSNLTFSCNGGNRVFPDNGYAFRFATDFTVSSRSPYIRNITVLTKGSVTSLSDPLGYNAGDAGKGAYIDGAYATALSKEASMLFHSVTFICPGVDVIVATNGTRVEWLNSFTYYANRSMYLYSSNDGFAGNGKTRIKITSKTGTWAVGNTLYYYDTDSTTVLAQGVIESIDGDFYNIDGRVLGFETPSDRAGKTITVHGDAKLATAIRKFGSASLALDGTGDYLSLADQPDFAFGTGDFCLEAWVYRTTNSGTSQILFDFRTATSQIVPNVFLSATYVPGYLVNGSQVITGSAPVALNTWTHIAVSRSGTSTKLFVNGTQSGSTYTDTNNYIQCPLVIGARFDGTLGFPGYIDDIRISKDVARYTTTFPVPTAQLTGDISTVLLITCNGANNSTAIADNGITLQDLRTSAGGRASVINFADYSDFGVELRSIGSAAVYGNYGVYGDGVGVIAYLIGQNLAYIGNGAATTNDPNTVIQANEVVELNDAKIFYNSVDHKGDFRVGDLFYVNQATGEVSFTNSAVNIGTSLTFDNGLGDVTYLDATKIETGDFRISGNTVETLTQDFNVDSATNQINLQSNVTVTGNLDVTGDVTVGGNVTIGNESTDVVRFVAGVDSDILPKLDSTYDLGTSTERWSTLYSTTLVNAKVQISTNVITTTDSNLDLTLQANGTGRVYVPTNNVEITNNLTVNGVTDVQALNVTGTLTHVGAVTQTGNVTQTGDITLTGTFTTTGYGQFADIKINNNNISTTISNNDLVLDAAGTGRVYVPDSNVEITQDLTVTGYIDVGSLNVDTSISSLTLTAGDVKIQSNYITTLTGNNNLELRANGSGLIYVPANNVEITNNLTVLGTTNLKTTNIGVVGTPSTVTHVGAVTQTGNLTQTGSTEITGTLTVGSTAQFQDIKIDTNIITTTIGNNNLTLKANGTGIVIIPDDNVSITQTLTVTGTTGTTTINNTGTITSDTFNTSNVSINSNNITSRTGNSNLVLEAAGTGKIYVPSNNVQLDQNLTVNGTTYLKGTNIGVIGTPATVTHVGAVTQTGNLTQTGSTEITGTLTVGSTAQFQDIKIDTNVITTTVGNNNLILKANGTGIVIIPDDNVSISQTLTVTGTTSTSTINNTGTVTSTIFSTGNIRITTNNITTTVADTDLVLEASGTGRIYVPSNDVTLGKTLTVTGLTTLADTNITGTLTHVGATTRTGDVNQTGNYVLTGNLTVSNIAQFKDVNITNNVITTTLTNSNLQLGAAGTGIISVPTNNVTIDNNLTVTGTTFTANINNSGTVTAGTFTTGNISINGNTIQTTVSNSNLQLQAAGTGYIVLEQFDVQENEIRINTGSDMVLTPNGTGIVTVNSTQSIKLPVGNIAARPTGAAGMIRFNSELSRYEGYNGTAWVRLDGVEDADGNTKITAEATPGANDNTIRFYTNGTQVADLTSTRLNVINIDVDAININNNVISTTTTDTNLVLTPNGTGSVRTGNFSINGSTITNTVNNSITYFNQTGDGYVKINSTGGFVIPTGLTTQRPPLFDIGMMRYNTDPGNFRVEVWDGANWVNAGQAAGGGVTLAEAQDIGIVSAIIFG